MTFAVCAANSLCSTSLTGLAVHSGSSWSNNSGLYRFALMFNLSSAFPVRSNRSAGLSNRPAQQRVALPHLVSSPSSASSFTANLIATPTIFHWSNCQLKPLFSCLKWQQKTYFLAAKPALKTPCTLPAQRWKKASWLAAALHCCAPSKRLALSRRQR